MSRDGRTAKISSGTIVIRRELKIQVNDLQKRIAAAVDDKLFEVYAPLNYANMHSRKVAAVALYGEPKIEEPLWNAARRAEQKLHDKFVAAAEELWSRQGEGVEMNLFVRAALCQTLMFDNLPGDNDNTKFKQIFSEAPVWLLKFTAVEWDAKILGFKLRELVGAPELGRRARLDRNSWPSLPSETIKFGGPCSEPDEPWEEIVNRRCDELLKHRRQEQRFEARRRLGRGH